MSPGVVDENAIVSCAGLADPLSQSVYLIAGLPQGTGRLDHAPACVVDVLIGPVADGRAIRIESEAALHAGRRGDAGDAVARRTVGIGGGRRACSLGGA